MSDFEIRLPAIRGVQAGRPFYIALCPARFLSRLISSEQSKEGAFAREADRALVQDIAQYLASNPSSYVLPALTCLVDGAVEFEENRGATPSLGMGTLRVPYDSHILVLDGVNRLAGIESALKLRPELGQEAMPILLYVESAGGRIEQMLSDVRRNGSRTARSQGILCDARDETARITRALIQHVESFSGMTETVRSTISNRSLKLFTFSAIYHATTTLLSCKRDEPFEDRLALAVEFWTEVSRQIPDWMRAKAGEVSPAELRKSFVHAHAIALAAMARVGKSLLERYPRSWKRSLTRLRGIDWARSNAQLWEGRAMIAGRLSKANASVILTGNVIKERLGIPLTADEQSLEEKKRAVRG
jgi:DNA sulfur modification protein DndB